MSFSSFSSSFSSPSNKDKVFHRDEFDVDGKANELELYLERSNPKQVKKIRNWSKMVSSFLKSFVFLIFIVNVISFCSLGFCFGDQFSKISDYFTIDEVIFQNSTVFEKDIQHLYLNFISHPPFSLCNDNKMWSLWMLSPYISIVSFSCIVMLTIGHHYGMKSFITSLMIHMVQLFLQLNVFHIFEPFPIGTKNTIFLTILLNLMHLVIHLHSFSYPKKSNPFKTISNSSQIDKEEEFINLEKDQNFFAALQQQVEKTFSENLNGLSLESTIEPREESRLSELLASLTLSGNSTETNPKKEENKDQTSLTSQTKEPSQTIPQRKFTKYSQILRYLFWISLGILLFAGIYATLLYFYHMPGQTYPVIPNEQDSLEKPTVKNIKTTTSANEEHRKERNCVLTRYEEEHAEESNGELGNLKLFYQCNSQNIHQILSKEEEEKKEEEEEKEEEKEKKEEKIK